MTIFFLTYNVDIVNISIKQSNSCTTTKTGTQRDINLDRGFNTQLKDSDR